MDNEPTTSFTESDMSNAFEAGYAFCDEYSDRNALSYKDWIRDAYNIELRCHYALTYKTCLDGPTSTTSFYVYTDEEATKFAAEYFKRQKILPAYMTVERIS